MTRRSGVLVSTVLSELGYAFVEAGDAAAALPVLDSGQRIDLMISDVGLPGMNGRQLAEIGRQYRPGLKVLFITGYAEHAAVRGGVPRPWHADDHQAVHLRPVNGEGCGR